MMFKFIDKPLKDDTSLSSSATVALERPRGGQNLPRQSVGCCSLHPHPGGIDKKNIFV